QLSAPSVSEEEPQQNRPRSEPVPTSTAATAGAEQARPEPASATATPCPGRKPAAARQAPKRPRDTAGQRSRPGQAGPDLGRLPEDPFLQEDLASWLSFLQEIMVPTSHEPQADSPVPVDP